MREREAVTTKLKLARNQNFLDQPPFAELLEDACWQNSIPLADLRRGLIYYARAYYKKVCDQQENDRRITVGDLQGLSWCKGPRPDADRRKLKQLPKVTQEIGQKLFPLVLKYIATQWDQGQYYNNGEPKWDVNRFESPLTCESWVRERQCSGSI